MSQFKKLEACIACLSTDLSTYLDLGAQPLANSYSGGDLPSYPLAINFCGNCFHSQLTVAVNPELMFRNYLYVSGTSDTLRKYFSNLSEYIQDTYAPKSLLDVGCNDGSFLAAVKKVNPKIATFGVDPAENLYAQSSQHGTIIPEMWSIASSRLLKVPIDIITAQNVFAHTAQVEEFLTACLEVMHLGSKIIIQTSQARMHEDFEFDTIYHEHISFFNLDSMQHLASRFGLTVEKVQLVPIHGTSYMFTLGFGSADESVHNFSGLKTKEQWKKICAEFGARARKTVTDLKALIDSSALPVIGYGAAAKGNTLLNFGKIELDFIVDDNPLKQGLVTPGMQIPIRAPFSLLELDGNLLIVPLAWNFYSEIKAKVKSLRPNNNDLFVNYFPRTTCEV